MKIIELLLSILYRISKKDKRFSYYKSLSKNLTFNREEIIKIQQEKIRRLVHHAYHNTDYYRNLFDKNKICPEEILTKDDLAKIPSLTKEIIRNNIPNLISKDSHGLELKKITSGGSSGNQTTIFQSRFSEDIARGSWMRNNSMIGWMPTDKSAWIWGSPIEHTKYGKSILTRIGIMLNRRIILNAFKYSEKDFVDWHLRLVKFEPKVVYGYATIIEEFSAFLIKNKMSIPSIKIVVTTAEKLTNRKVIEKAFNCKVYDQYGCREVVAIGIEVDENEMVLTDDVVMLNLNKKNEFLITPLYSFGFPLINYKNGDVGEISSDYKEAVRGPFNLIKLKIGRITDDFLNQKNQKVSTSAISTYLSTLDLKIKQHQIIQKNYSEFVINYIADKNTNKNDYFNKVVFTLENHFGSNLEIKFNNVSQIPVEKSGKKLMFKRTFNIN